jgi:G3E family GTPase
VEYIINNTLVRNIVVETNGLADPAASIKQFWFDEQMSINAELHSVITMVSARKWDEVAKDEIFMKKLVFANKIIVSFVDVMGEEKYR